MLSRTAPANKISVQTLYYIQLQLKENEDWDEYLYFVTTEADDIEKFSGYVLDTIKHVKYRIIKEKVKSFKKYQIFKIKHTDKD